MVGFLRGAAPLALGRCGLGSYWLVLAARSAVVSVYVDHARIHFRGMLMCHMFADSRDELETMARRLGLKKNWYQKGSTLEHYDVSLSKRALAIKKGAIAVDVEWVRARIRADTDRILNREKKPHGDSDKDVARPPAVGHRADNSASLGVEDTHYPRPGVRPGGAVE